MRARLSTRTARKLAAKLSSGAGRRFPAVQLRSLLVGGPMAALRHAKGAQTYVGPGFAALEQPVKVSLHRWRPRPGMAAGHQGTQRGCDQLEVQRSFQNVSLQTPSRVGGTRCTSRAASCPARRNTRVVPICQPWRRACPRIARTTSATFCVPPTPRRSQASQPRLAACTHYTTNNNDNNDTTTTTNNNTNKFIILMSILML